MTRLLYLMFFLASFGAGLFMHQASLNAEVFQTICDLTQNNFYKQDEKLEQWGRRCRLFAAKASGGWSKKRLVQAVQDHMNGLEASHYLIYSPSEDKKLWTGVALDTGIRARYVEDHLVIYRVLPASVAAKKGFRSGDEILEISGTEQVTPWGAQNRSGTFTILRGHDMIAAEIQATELKTDAGPRLERLSSKTAMLEIPSFRSEYFNVGEWRAVAAQLPQFQHVIIDIRDNAGGNFVAMLRALSTFYCGDQLIGKLMRPRKALRDKAAFDDNTEDSYQIRELESHRSLGLRTFDGYGCYRGQVTVLIGSDTSSVSEIFAHSFFNRPRSRVWGQPSAGDVLLAVWYELPGLGPGYSVSIPEAVYLTPANEELENHGVNPQKEIFYDLQTALKGKDTFVEEAMR